MKKILLSLILVLGLFFSLSSVVNAGYVNGYYRSNGTYVSGYYRSNPNVYKNDNYGYTGGSIYNSSYGKYNTYKYNTPSYRTQSNYYTGLNSYRNSRLRY